MFKETVAMTETLCSVCSNASEEITEVYEKPKTVVSGSMTSRQNLHRKEVKTMQLNEEIRSCYATKNLTLWLLMSYIYGAPSKARNANVVYIWTYVWQR